MYFCNSSGILEFDGIKWRMVSETENLDMLKVVCGTDGKIYTGGMGEFGYLGQSPKAGIRFNSLKHLLPDPLLDFGRIMTLKAVGDSIVFLSPKYLFIYHNDSVTIHPTKDRYLRLLNYQGRLVVQLSKAGLCEFKGGELIPMHHNDLPKGRIVRHMLGPQSKPILVCNRKGTLQIDNKDLQYHPSLLDNLLLWNGARLKSNTHAIGSNEKGVLIIDEQAQIKEVFHKEYDLTGQSVISPFFDRNNQLWLASSNGIQNIEYPSQLSYFDENIGIRGIPLCIDESDQGIMVGTTEGLFIQNKLTGRFEKATIEKQKHADEFVTNILNLQDDKLILTIYGLFQKVGEKYNRISDMGGFDFAIIDSSETKLVYGGEDGIVVVDKIEGKWQTSFTIDTMNHDILAVTAQGDRRLWASMFSISRIDLSENGAQVTTLDSTHGFIPEMGPTWSFIHHDKAYFCTPIGLYSWNEKSQQLEPDDLLGEAFSKGAMSNPVVMGDSAVWVSHELGIGMVDLNTKEFKDRDLRRVDYSDVWRIHPSRDGHFWILTTEAIIRYDPSVSASYQEGFNAIIRTVKTKKDSILFDGYFNSSTGAPSLIQPDSMQPILDYSHNQVSIAYAATYYNATDRTTFSTFLDGQDEYWSPWSNQPFKDYMNLREGRYTFKVKARNVYGAEGSMASYTFSIRAPWYRSNWAYLFYAICAALGVWGIAILSSLHLRRQKIILEGIVVDRTRKIEEEKQKSDNLLLNILPAEVAEELKAKGSAEAKQFDEVTVLFTDFKNFTQISERMTAKELVAELHACFRVFDEIIEKHGIEKIKTIGDSYMCVGGLPVIKKTHALDVINAAIEIQEFLHTRALQRTAAGKISFQARIGINTGPVVAGIVGIKKFAYDIWGDTVNTASRIESSGEVGKVNISGTTYELVKDQFKFTYRGKVQVKGKGEVDMYFVEKPV